ncbi:pectate lyase family protein [Kallotenue papyrolyticum]|uniref:pectate lyase family protein n=1 Tax=Kallotenue papyrolyticum TaxID=1325125 RepID=UPI0004785514|nr:hypothetical protein [Kallotenue papyrolyticum]
MRHITQLLTAALLLTGLGLSPVAAGGRDLGREVLGPRDGWAAAEGGTTGGAAAAPEHVAMVSTWAEFRAALGGAQARGDITPRIVYVQGQIDANLTPDGRRLTCEDYADPAYSLEAYLAAYDPATWGRRRPSGPLEEARARSAANQAAQIRQYIGSNVTIVGLGDDARIVGANLVVRDAENVIIRNLELSDAYDCFPAWDPLDGSSGNWNAAYDNLWIANARHVWIDHNTFNDGAHPPATLPTYFGRKYEVHDGLLDITNGADLITVSYNRFENHDKAMLIGSSNTSTVDPGRLRVTLHHNLFRDMGQRTPRVRFGQVHVYNNYYHEPSGAIYSYSWGVGVQSQIYAENNFFALAPTIAPAQVIVDWGGTGLYETGTLLNGRARHNAVSLLAAYNAAHDPDLSGARTWQPMLYERIDPTQAVPALVRAHAGAGRITGR